MAPLLDYLNHDNVDDSAKLVESSESDCSDDDDEFADRMTLRGALGIECGYTIFSGQKFGAGEEVLFEYGKHSNEELLYHYGFLLDHNIYSRFPLSKWFDNIDEIVGGSTAEEKKLKKSFLATIGIGVIPPQPELCVPSCFYWPLHQIEVCLYITENITLIMGSLVGTRY